MADMVEHGVAPRATREELVAALTPGTDPIAAGFARGFAGALPRIADWGDDELAQVVRDGLSDLLSADESEERLMGVMDALIRATLPGWPPCARSIRPRPAPSARSGSR